MFSILREIHPVTGIEFALYCNFFRNEEKNLVVAGANVIKVYRLIPDFQVQRGRQENKKIKIPKMKLECMGSYNLFGNIMSMQSVALYKCKRDALLLSFKEAKLSLVEYDPNIHNLKTLSLHYFEEPEMKEGCTQNYNIPLIRVDPEDRCAVMLVYGKKLVVLPFRRELTSDDPAFVNTSSLACKGPVMASYMIQLKQLDSKMDNVIDINFLHGYYEPTLLILYEPLKTYAGRIAIHQDTCALVAISINIQQKVHPIIWSVSNLPFDCIKCLSVPKPIGGTLIFAVNSLLYLNQSVPPYGISLNSIADLSTNFPLRHQDGIKMTLDCSEATFISYNKLVISLKGGELYVLTLIADNMRSIHNLHFDKAASSVLTTSMCVCENNYLFLGSRLGNSLLLRYVEKEQADNFSVQKRISEPILKKKKLDVLGDWMATDVTTIQDADELEVYGTEDCTNVRLTQFSFDVCDSLLNIGPCGDISMGEPAFLSEEFSNSLDPDVELVTTSGYGKNGALSVLQRSIRPQVITTFELPGVLNMWTVTVNSNEAQSFCCNSDYHSYLILSRKDNTMVLQAGQEINELDNSSFITQSSTILAGNIGGGQFIFQVTHHSVRLLNGPEQIQHIPFDQLKSTVLKATVADPYIVLLMESNELVLLTLQENKNISRLFVSFPCIDKTANIVAISAYRDLSGLFVITKSEEWKEFEKSVAYPNKVTTTLESSFNATNNHIDDEDQLLYGESESVFNTNYKEQEEAIFQKEKNWELRLNWYLRDICPTLWLAVACSSGELKIYSLPDFVLHYLVNNFILEPTILFDQLDDTANKNKSPEHSEIIRQIQEILLIGLGHNNRRPMLLARIDEDLVIYEAYPFYGVENSNLCIRFKKLSHNLILREKKSKSRKRQDFQGLLSTQKWTSQNWLRSFSNIAGYSGVFISGYYPHWMFMTSRGEPRFHSMGIDGCIFRFSSFHNVNCPQGFLYFNNKDELRICVLPTHLSYDAPWPVRKVPLRCTPHYITYHVESKTYCVVTSQSDPSNRVYRFNGDDKELFIEERDDRFPFPLVDLFTIQLFSPVSWEVIPNTKIECDEWEHVTCLKTVSLAYEGARSGRKGYLAVGTNYNYGEDITSRGKIIIMDVIEVVPEPGQPLTKNKIKLIYSKEQKGPVTALAHVHGFLVAAIGQKVYIWQLKDNDLVGIAFMDMHIYIHQMLPLKSLIYVADVYKSVSVLRFQSEFRTLSLTCKDFRSVEVYAIEYYVDNTQLGFFASDVEKNVTLLVYNPEARESHGGMRMMRKGDIHVGSHINCFFRIRCKLTDPSTDKKNTTSVEKRHATMFATLDGSLGYFLPISEKIYRRLQMLQNVLNSFIPHVAGLNPKEFRTFKSSLHLLSNPSRNILDGELIWKYLQLSLNEKVEIAKKIGTKIDEIIEDLMEIDRYTSHF